MAEGNLGKPIECSGSSKFERIGHAEGVPVVRCCYNRNGCQWNDKEMLAEDHARSCIYKPITCKYCKKVILKVEYNDHLLHFCKNKMFLIIGYLVGDIAIYQCCNQESGCKWIGTGNHKKDHVYRCNYRSIICTCCEEVILKGFYYVHLMNFCRNRMDGSHYEEWDQPSFYLCPRSHLGCKWRGTPTMFEKQHQYQCNKQLKPCAVCGKKCMKGAELCSHVQNDCSLRLNHAEGDLGNGVYTFNNEPPSQEKKQV